MEAQELQDARNKRKSLWDLRNRSLKSLPEDFFTLTCLHVLNLQGTKLISLSPSIGQLTNLQVLDISCNQLKEIPVEIGSLVRLRTLMAYNNRINMIPYTIGNLSSLKCLSLRLETYLCTQLEVLSVSHNRLTALPELLERLTNLKELNLSQNRIQLLTSLPTSLTYLNLSGNQLEALPEVATRLVNLTELNLEGNKLKKLPAMLVNMVSLKRLKIEFNPLQDIDPSTTAQEILMQLQKQREEAKRAQVKVGNVATSSKRPRTPTPPQEGPEVDKPPEDTKLQPPAAPSQLTNNNQEQEEPKSPSSAESKGERSSDVPADGFDSDTGMVDKRELMKSFLAMRNSTLEEKLRSKCLVQPVLNVSVGFNLYDVNGDGTISEAELSNMLRSIASMVEKRHPQRYSAKGLDKFIHNFVRTTFYLYNNHQEDQGLSFGDFTKAAQSDPEIMRFFTLDVLN